MSSAQRLACAFVCLVSAAVAGCGSPAACQEGYTARSGVCLTVWGNVAGTITLTGQQSSAGVLVALAGASVFAETDSSGKFSLAPVTAGRYTVIAQAQGYTTAQFPVTVNDGQTATVTGSLTLAPGPGSGSTTGHAYLLGATNNSGITVSVMGGGSTSMTTTMTAADGSYAFQNLAAGVYTLMFQDTGYTSQTVSDVVLTAGVFLVPDVTLWPATELTGKELASAQFLPASTKAIVALGDPNYPIGGEGTFIYSVSTGMLTQISGDSLSLVAGSADDSQAIVYGENGLDQLNTATGQLAPIQPPMTAYLGALGQSVYYEGADSSVYLATPSSATATLVTQLPSCAYAYGSMYLLSTSTGLSHWGYLELVSYNCGQDSEYSYALLSDASPTTVQFASTVAESPDQSVALVSQITSPTNAQGVALERINLATGTVTTLLPNAGPFSVASDWSWAYVTFDYSSTTGLQSYASFNPLNGTPILLATNAQPYEGGYVPVTLPLALLSVGETGDVRAVRFDLGTSVDLCPGGGELTGSQSTLMLCWNYEGTSTAYSPATNTATTLPASEENPELAGATVLLYNGSYQAWRPGMSQAVTLCPEGYYYRRTGNSASGAWMAFQCGTSDYPFSGSWRDLNVASGTSFNILGTSTVTQTVDNEEDNCIVSEGGTALCFIEEDEYGESYSCEEESYYCAVASSQSGHAVTGLLNPYGEGLFSADGSGYESPAYTETGVVFVNFATATPQIIQDTTAGDEETYGVGHDGVSALQYNGGAFALYNASQDMLTAIGAAETQIVQITNSDVFIIGSTLVNLDAPSVTPAQDVVVSTNGAVVSYVDPSSQTLYSFSASTGVVTLATDVVVPTTSGEGGPAFYFTGVQGGVGALAALNVDAGTLTTILPSAATALGWAGSAPYAFGSPDSSGSSGELYLVNPTTLQATDLGAKANVVSAFVEGGSEVAFLGPDSSGNPALFVAQLNGSGHQQLASGSATFAFVGSPARLLFTVGGVTWIQSSGTNPPVALGGDNGTIFIDISPNEKVVLFDYEVTDYPASERNGGYEVAVP